MRLECGSRRYAKELISLRREQARNAHFLNQDMRFLWARKIDPARFEDFSGDLLREHIDVDWLAPGAFASPVDFDSYWTGAALHQADKLATDDIAQLDHYRQAGYFSDTPAPYADLGQIVAGHRPGRESKDERIISINLGLALEDMATAMPIYHRALELGIGTRLPL